MIRATQEIQHQEILRQKKRTDLFRLNFQSAILQLHALFKIKQILQSAISFLTDEFVTHSLP